jgi:hypothetical protein
MAMAAYIIGMQTITPLASQKNRVAEQGFLEFFQDDGRKRPPHGRLRSCRETGKFPRTKINSVESRCGAVV